jgi:(R,R)-butanediol dehydrogenase/meso-butanediol dehydrogenase/diacetyl reductase
LRVAYFHGPGRPITIEQVPEPRPERGEVLVRVCRCGICGSDVSMTATDAVAPYPPGPIGHEFAGEVIEIGAGVTELKVGDRIAAPPLIPCGRCEGCIGGHPFFCTALRGATGGFGELMTLPANHPLKLPATLSMADGALIEPVACGLHALRLAQVRGGERLLVLGAGAMALATIFWARRLGLGRIVVASRSAHRHESLMAMGADAVIALDAAEPAMLAEALGGPADIVAECVGKAGLLGLASQHVRPRGVVLSLGMCMQPDAVIPAICAFKEVRLFFPHGYTLDEYAETARAFEADLVRPDSMVSDVISLDSLPVVLEELRAGRKSLKVQVDPTLGAG